MPLPARRRWRVGPGMCVVAAVLFGTAVRAHEIGTTRVSVLLQEGGTYDIEIVTDATSLVEKLEASSGGSLPVGTSPAQLQSLLAGFDETFRRRVKVAFDMSE